MTDIERCFNFESEKMFEKHMKLFPKLDIFNFPGSLMNV